MNHDHSFTGFGDEPNTSVKFDVLMDGDRLPDWKSVPRTKKLEVLHSSRTVYQSGGRDDWAIAIRIALASVAELELLDSLIEHAATLRIPWGITKTAGGTHEPYADAEYLLLPDTTLDALEVDESQSQPDGYREAIAVFSRAYEDLHYVGFTLLSPEEA
jgi:hypothetical protein